MRTDKQVTIGDKTFNHISGNVYITNRQYNSHNPTNASYNVVIIVPSSQSPEGYDYIVQGRIIEDIGIGFRAGNVQPQRYYENIVVCVYQIIDALGLTPHFYKKNPPLIVKSNRWNTYYAHKEEDGIALTKTPKFSKNEIVKSYSREVIMETELSLEVDVGESLRSEEISQLQGLIERKYL